MSVKQALKTPQSSRCLLDDRTAHIHVQSSNKYSWTSKIKALITRKAADVLPGLRTQTHDSREDRILRPKITLSSQLRFLFVAWSTLLFAFAPAGFTLNYLHQDSVANFVVNFLAIIPSNMCLMLATEHLGMYMVREFKRGVQLDGLLSMTFGWKALRVVEQRLST
jgi:hypothetical protein